MNNWKVNVMFFDGLTNIRDIYACLCWGALTTVGEYVLSRNHTQDSVIYRCGIKRKVPLAVCLEFEKEYTSAYISPNLLDPRLLVNNAGVAVWKKKGIQTVDGRRKGRMLVIDCRFAQIDAVRGRSGVRIGLMMVKYICTSQYL